MQVEKTKEGITNHNYLIDILKCVCIIFVCITHFSWTSAERSNMGFQFWIDMAIPIFLLISGYVNCLSYQRKNINSLDEAFAIKNWLKSFIRYTIPFLIVFLIEVSLNIACGSDIAWYNYIFTFFVGGWGPGSYYYPILIQLLIIFPFIYTLIKKFKGKGLIICFGINFSWEIIKFPFSISSGCYRLLIFRYVFLIAFGCYTALFGYKNSKVNLLSWLGGGAGLIFSIFVQYGGYKPVIFTQWTSTCLLSILFIIPIFNLLVLKVNARGKVLKPFAYIGKCSYNIYFAQMVFFKFFSYKIDKMISARPLALFVDVVICVLVGILFYLAESRLTKRVINKAYSKLGQRK